MKKPLAIVAALAVAALVGATGAGVADAAASHQIGTFNVETMT